MECLIGENAPLSLSPWGEGRVRGTDTRQGLQELVLRN